MSIVLDGSNVSTTGVINSGTAVASTSGTAIDFTGIPAGTKRITVMLNGVSTNGSTPLQIQIGSGALVSSGYDSSASFFSNGSAATINSSAQGFLVTGSNSASYSWNGSIILTHTGSNTWVSQGITQTGTIAATCAGKSPALSGSLDRIRFHTYASADTFDAGSINILYE